jgi:hypothetical protein
MTGRRKRPRDFSQAAKPVIDIATGRIEHRPPTPEEQRNDPTAVAFEAPQQRISMAKAAALFKLTRHRFGAAATADGK